MVRTPTPEQAAVLRSPARVRVVRAAPGSGKTWLVAELIRQELEKWPTRVGGIAALSFTRVAGDEIRRAVRYELTHPHFVGTIDAFLFRYVVRPFLRRCFPSLAAPRLIPAEFGADHWNNLPGGGSTTAGRGINLFGCTFVDELDGKAVIAHKPHPARPLERVNDVDGEAVKNAKLAIWKRSGLLTHSDAALWSSKILAHSVLGAAVRHEVVRRFPLIVVDEFQDTGYFLGKSILLLLGEPSVRGVLVGDPDQAIYEFSGARPELFNRCDSIPDAVSLPLAKSRRCPPAVVVAAAHVKDSGGSIDPASDKTGRALLLVYGDMVSDVSNVIGAIVSVHGALGTKVLARDNATVIALSGRSAKTVPKLGCPPINHLQRAVVAFRQGRKTVAMAAARAALELVLFRHEGVDDAELESNGIEPTTWQDFSVKTLLRANAEQETGTIQEWQQRLGVLLDDEISRCGLSPAASHVAGRLKPKGQSSKRKIKEASSPCRDYLPSLGLSGRSTWTCPVQTVHSVKGETHDTTIFVCRDSKRDRCPSAVWWSSSAIDREEKRVAYVAMTRTRRDLLLCVSVAVYERFMEKRPDFVAAFECMPVAEYIGRLERETSTVSDADQVDENAASTGDLRPNDL
jgi:DNA helicase-2/ATP-dependent DNA helicase PcrA